MKVSIITVCFNSQKTIENTIQSVLTQDYPDIEYIIVDGKSTDNTLQIINKFSDRISKVISETDEGIYHAINKGIKVATGALIGLLNSDDIYATDDAISKIVNLIESKEVDCAYSDLIYTNRKSPDKILRYWKSKKYKRKLFLKGWMPPHPTFFVKKEIYERYGYYSTHLTISADYELMLRFLYKHQISVAYLPEITINMKTGGKSNSSLFNRLLANRQDRIAWRENGLTPGLFTLYLKPLQKMTQFICKPKEGM